MSTDQPSRPHLRRRHHRRQRRALCDADDGGAARAGLSPRGGDLRLRPAAAARRARRRGVGRPAARVPRRRSTANRGAAGSFEVLSNKDLGATIASGSHDCEAMVDRPVLDEDAGRRRARAVAQPGRARRRRHAEGEAPAGHRPARSADEPAAAEEHGALRRSGRDDPAGDARVLPDAEDARRPRRLHGGQDPVGPRLRHRPSTRSSGDRPAIEPSSE